MRKRPTNLIDQDPFNREYLELGEGYSQDAGVTALLAAVASHIEGGRPCSIQDLDPVDLEARRNESVPKPAIMKTRS